MRVESFAKSGVLRRADQDLLERLAGELGFAVAVP